MHRVMTNTFFGMKTTDQGEIELDIESLTKGTLWKLYKFVKGNAAKPRKGKSAGQRNLR